MTDYYAIDEYEHTALRDAMAEKILATAQGRWFALMDKAFDHGSQPLGANLVGEHCLYRRGRLEALREVSPYLIPLDSSNPEALRKILGRLLFHCRKRPMLSFLRSNRKGEELVEYWQDFLEVTTDDDQAFLLRIADSRVLPALADCTGRLWNDLANGIDEWWIINRVGDLEKLPLPEAEAVRANEGAQASIDKKGFACLLDAGLPDALATQLQEHFPDLLAERGGAANYRLLQSTCALAKRHGLEAFPEQFSLSVAVLYSHGSLLDDPQFESWMMEKPWVGKVLEDVLGDYLEKAEATQ